MMHAGSTEGERLCRGIRGREERERDCVCRGIRGREERGRETVCRGIREREERNITCLPDLAGPGS